TIATTLAPSAPPQVLRSLPKFRRSSRSAWLSSSGNEVAAFFCAATVATVLMLVSAGAAAASTLAGVAGVLAAVLFCGVSKLVLKASSAGGRLSVLVVVNTAVFRGSVSVAGSAASALAAVAVA